MTDSMVERVARALCADDGTDPDGLDSQGQVWWTCYEDSARAAIAAMREPTEAMLGEHNRGLVRRVWQSAIDTALEHRGEEG